MDIRRLEAFCKVFELGSFSKAAQELFLSQPTISAHVLTLEDELQVQLFDRLGRMILPTQAGTVLYQHARDIFVSLERARAEIGLLQDKVAGGLLIGASTIPANYLLPRILADFSLRYPSVVPELRIADTSKVLELVQGGEVVVGVVGAEADMPELDFLPIFDDQLVCIASPKFRQEHGAVFGTKEICTWPWVMRERGSGTRRNLEKALLAAGLDERCLHVALTVDSTEALLQCVLAGLGVGVTSLLAAQPFLERGEMETLDTPVLSIQRRLFLVRHAKRHIFPAPRYFMEFLRDACKELSPRG